MPIKNAMPSITLRQKEERRLLNGHCWIFSNELEKVDTAIEPGELCSVRDYRGLQIATAFFNPHSLIAARILKRGEGALENDFIYARLARAYENRKSIGLDKYARVCFGESDFLPGLVVDRYGDCLVVDILAAGMERQKAAIIDALKKLYQPAGIYLCNDSSFRKLEGLTSLPEIIGTVPDIAEIEENGLKFQVPLKTGQKTGFYYDQRENREFLKPYFKGRTVLDLYSYVGAFALCAAKAGAEQVWGVDTSGPAVELAIKNAELNDLDDVAVFHKEDSERALSAMRAGTLPVKPDFVLLDPPNLVHGRKNLPNAGKLYVKLNEMALQGLPAGGYLATSSCSHHISREIFMDMLTEAAARSGKNVHLLELRGQAKDHPVLLGVPETEYLHFALLRVN